MDYDPYGQQDYGYGVYDGGFGYEEEIPDGPMPPPDKNWVDPIKVNRDYLKRIQKDCVHDDFKGLKEEGFYLLEVLCESILLKKEFLIQNEPTERQGESTEDKKEEHLTTHVKFLNFPFLEVNGSQTTEKSEITERVVSFTDVFQRIFTSTGRYRLLNEIRQDSRHSHESTSSLEATDGEEKTGINENNDQGTAADYDTFEVMKGKGALIAMTGLEMIQCLQQHKVQVRVDRGDVTLGTASVLLPESFRLAVLKSSCPDAVLPCFSIYPGRHALDNDSGKLSLSIKFTCYGQAIVNRVEEIDDSIHVRNARLWNRFKFNRSSAVSDSLSNVHPKVALQILKAGLPVDTRTSSEILQDCIASKRIDIEPPIGQCPWFGMAKDVLPRKSNTMNLLKLEQFYLDNAKEMALLWRKHRQICRNLRRKEDERSQQPSLYERLEQMGMPKQEVEADYLFAETDSPFEKEAHRGISDLELAEGSIGSGKSHGKSSLKNNKQ